MRGSEHTLARTPLLWAPLPFAAGHATHATKGKEFATVGFCEPHSCALHVHDVVHARRQLQEVHEDEQPDNRALVRQSGKQMLWI